jgi:hypothetical protein
MCVLSLESLCKRSGNCGRAGYVATHFGGRYKRSQFAASLTLRPDVRQGRRRVKTVGATPERALLELWVVSGSALNYLTMIEVDDSELDEDDREFLERWAKPLGVPVGVLILRIVEAAIDGDQYIAKRPRDPLLIGSALRLCARDLS